MIADVEVRRVETELDQFLNCSGSQLEKKKILNKTEGDFSHRYRRGHALSHCPYRRPRRQMHNSALVNALAVHTTLCIGRHSSLEKAVVIAELWSVDGGQRAKEDVITW